MADAAIGVEVKKEPFMWLWDVDVELSAGSILRRIYEVVSGERLLMAKLWVDAPNAAKQFQFYKGVNAATTEISHILLSTNLPQIEHDEEAFDDTKPHLKMLIGGGPGEDLMCKWIIGASETYVMHFQLFFETV